MRLHLRFLPLGLVVFASLTACVEESAAKKKLQSINVPSKMCLDRSPSGASIPEPTAPVLSIADDIHLAFNCIDKLDIKWEKNLRDQDIVLGDKVIVAGSAYGCSVEGAFPSITYVPGINADLKKAIDSYNQSAKTKYIAVNEALNDAINNAKSCSFKAQGDLQAFLSNKANSLMLDRASNQAPVPDNSTRLESSILLDELSCLGTVSLKPSSNSELFKTYDSLRTKLSQDSATKASQNSSDASCG